MELCGELNTFVPDRLLDDDGAALIRYEGGAKGVLAASQIAVGVENGLNIRVYGEKGGLEWRQEEPNTMIMRGRIVRRRSSVLPMDICRVSPLIFPYAGRHPEGYIEAFANLYRNFALALRSILAGEEPAPETLDFPSAEDGVRGMRFIETIVATGSTENKWIKIID